MENFILPTEINTKEKTEENNLFTSVFDSVKNKTNILLLLTTLFTSPLVQAKEKSEKIDYTRYESDVKITRMWVRINLRLRTQDELETIWSTRRFIADDDRYNQKPLAFVLYDPDGTCNIYAPIPVKWWNDDHALREIGHEVLHCFWAKHEYR